MSEVFTSWVVPEVTAAVEGSPAESVTSGYGDHTSSNLRYAGLHATECRTTGLALFPWTGRGQVFRLGASPQPDTRTTPSWTSAF